MKSKILFIYCLSFLSLASSAAVLKVLDPCTGEHLINENITKEYESVGVLTAEVLSSLVTDFSGSELGVNAMFGTPVGEEALEIISRRKMRAYGWCYSVNGVSPEVYPSDFLLNKYESQVVEWFYGYADYDSGTWKTQCEKLHLTKHPFICSKR